MNHDPVGETLLPGTGRERSVSEFLLAMLSGSALAPFVQAIATKAGDDVHDKIRGLLARHRRKGDDPEPGKSIILTDTEKAIMLELPATLSTGEAAQLAAVRVPPSICDQWLFVYHDPESGSWRAIVVKSPPSNAIEVDNHNQEP